MSFAPRFNHDGSRMLMSIAEHGTTSIYEMDLRSRAMQRLTNNPGVIDTSPSYAPDGHAIVFNSDRGGSQQLYVMDGEWRQHPPHQLWLRANIGDARLVARAATSSPSPNMDGGEFYHRHHEAGWFGASALLTQELAR